MQGRCNNVSLADILLHIEHGRGYTMSRSATGTTAVLELVGKGVGEWIDWRSLIVLKSTDVLGYGIRVVKECCSPQKAAVPGLVSSGW